MDQTSIELAGVHQIKKRAVHAAVHSRVKVEKTCKIVCLTEDRFCEGISSRNDHCCIPSSTQKSHVHQYSGIQIAARTLAGCGHSKQSGGALERRLCAQTLFFVTELANGYINTAFVAIFWPTYHSSHTPRHFYLKIPKFTFVLFRIAKDPPCM